MLNGSGNGARSGAETLLLLATPLDAAILRAVEQRPRQQAELRRETGLPAQTTLRAQLKRLVQIGALAKRRRDAFPGRLAYELTGAGHDLLVVARLLERWLATAPGGPLTPLDGPASKTAVKALTAAWSSGILRAIAARPLTLTELDRVIPALSYPSLERRLDALRVAGLIETASGGSRGTPYAPTAWLREATSPLAAACRWERRNMPDASPPLGRIEVETTFLLALPLLVVDNDLAGRCRLAVEAPNGSKRAPAGVTVSLAGGRATCCSASSDGHPDAWICGPPAAWLAAGVEGDGDGLERGGDSRLAGELLGAVHNALAGRAAGAVRGEALLAAPSGTAPASPPHPAAARQRRAQLLPPAKRKLVRARVKTVPGKPSGAGQPALIRLRRAPR